MQNEKQIEKKKKKEKGTRELRDNIKQFSIKVTEERKREKERTKIF